MKFAHRVLLFAAFILLFTSASVRADEMFPIAEYHEFHEVLHPLEHEALPQKDFARIRAAAPQLQKLGKAIVKLGIPSGTEKEKKAEFAEQLKKFEVALKRFGNDARRGTDEKLKRSYSSVHDSFEMLAALLPRRSANRE